MMRREWMGSRTLVVMILACASCGCSGDGRSAAGEDLVLLPVPADPTATFKVWFPTGSARDPEGKEGLAWLTGQMISEGATTRHRYEEILEALYPMAASYSVRVDREMTVLTGRTHLDNIDAFFALFADAYLRPAFNEDDFKRLQTDTLNYLQNALRYAQDEELAKAAFASFVFDGQRYAHPPQGTVQSVQALTVEDVRQFYRRHYTRQGATFALGGGYDESWVDTFRQTRSELPDGAPEIDAVPVAPEFEGRHVLLVDKPGADASVSFGFPLDVRRGTREFYALWIANSWLGEHRNSSSHLFQVIREKRGMNYGDYSYIEAFPNGGRRSFPPTHVGRSRQSFEVWIRTLPNERSLFALRAAIRELRLLVENGMDPQAFELTRSFLKKYVLHFADNPAARLGYAVDDRFYGIDGAGHLARFRSMMDEITLDEVNAAIRKHLGVADLKIAIVTGDATGLRDALLEGSPTPIEYATPKPESVIAEDVLIAAEPLDVTAERLRIIAVADLFER